MLGLNGALVECLRLLENHKKSPVESEMASLGYSIELARHPIEVIFASPKMRYSVLTTVVRRRHMLGDIGGLANAFEKIQLQL